MTTVLPTSTIQNFTDALVANLQARPGLAQTLISDGPPPPAMLQTAEWLMIGDVHGGRKWAAIARPRLPQDEEYTVDVVISVVSPSTASDTSIQPALNRRAMEIFAELEDELRRDPQQGVGPSTGIVPAGYVIESHVATPVRLQKRASDTAREAAMEIGVYVKARL